MSFVWVNGCCRALIKYTTRRKSVQKKYLLKKIEDYVAEIILRSNAQIYYTDYGLQEIRMRQKRERKE